MSVVTNYIEEDMWNTVQKVIESVLGDQLCKKCRFSYNHPIFDVKHISEFTAYLGRLTESEKKDIIRLHDKNGYSFVHYMSWSYINKKPRSKSPDIAAQHFLILNWIVDNFDIEFLREIYSEGLPEDEKCTPIHYFAQATNSYLTREENIYLNRLCTKGMSDIMQRPDSFETTVSDYIALKIVPYEMKTAIYRDQKDMKAIETGLSKLYTSTFPEYFATCSKCRCYLHFFTDLRSIPFEKSRTILTDEVRRDIQVVIDLRERIISHHQILSSRSESRENSHRHCINIWKEKLVNKNERL